MGHIKSTFNKATDKQRKEEQQSQLSKRTQVIHQYFNYLNFDQASIPLRNKTKIEKLDQFTKPCPCYSETSYFNDSIKMTFAAKEHP